MFSLCLSTGGWGGGTCSSKFCHQMSFCPRGVPKKLFSELFPQYYFGGSTKKLFSKLFPQYYFGGSPNFFFRCRFWCHFWWGGGGGPEFWSSELLDFLGGSRVLNFWISWRGPDVTPPRYHPPIPPPTQKKFEKNFNFFFSIFFSKKAGALAIRLLRSRRRTVLYIVRFPLWAKKTE